MTIDDDLRDSSLYFLRNAFWKTFSEVVNRYRVISSGTVEDFDMYMQEIASVYGRDKFAKSPDCDNFISVSTTNSEGVTVFHKSLLEALQCDTAETISLNGLPVFRRKDGNWIEVH